MTTATNTAYRCRWQGQWQGLWRRIIAALILMGVSLFSLVLVEDRLFALGYSWTAVTFSLPRRRDNGWTLSGTTNNGHHRRRQTTRYWTTRRAAAATAAAAAATATPLLFHHRFYDHHHDPRRSIGRRTRSLISLRAGSTSSTTSSSSFWQEGGDHILVRNVFQQPAGVPRQLVQDMIQRSQHLKNKKKLFIVVVTGATGGLGSAIVQAVLELGGLVVAVDRDAVGLDRLIVQQPQQQQQHEDRIRTVVADFADLESVARAAQEVWDQVSHIDILVNNAGISYAMDDDDEEAMSMLKKVEEGVVSSSLASKQNYDLLFQINYLSHFLWTERLLPKVLGSSNNGGGEGGGRIVSIASGFSWGVNGTGLLPSSPDDGLDDPAASRVFGQRPSSSGCWPRHLAMAYSHSKLAQIWHMAELNRRYNTNLAVCACPSWAATGISGNEEGRQALERFAFPTQAKDPEVEVAGPALRSILNAMFLPTSEMDPGVWKGESFLGNANVLETLLPKSKTTGQNHFLFSDWADQNLIPRVDMARNVAIWGVLLLQRWFHQDLYFQPTSQESSNATAQALLYDWSSQAVAEWLPIEQGDETRVSPLFANSIRSEESSSASSQVTSEEDPDMILLVS